jgi:hypothetical protein
MALDPNSRAAPDRFPIFVFLIALSIRSTYSALIFVTAGNAGLMGVDSIAYLANATAFAEGISQGRVGVLQWLGPNPNIMPLFNGLLTLCVLLTGSIAPLLFVLIQGALDSVTCVATGRLAGALDNRLFKPAAVLACLNPTQIVLAGLVYTDTLFLFFTALFLLGAIRWMRAPSWRSSALLGVALSGAALTRVLVVPWAAAMIIFLLLARMIGRDLRVRQIVQLTLAGAILALSMGAVALRNATQYGSWELTAQDGIHLNLWVVPLIREARDGTPWAKSFEEMQRRKDERFPAPDPNPFVQSRQHREIAMEELRGLRLHDIGRAWLFGAAINLISPAIIISPPVQTLPRTGFFATSGNSVTEKVMNFLFRSESRLYVRILLIGAVGVGIIRVIQLFGFLTLLRNWGIWPELLVLGAWCGFVLLVNGPIASPKYRLPIEPVLMVAAAAGLVQMRSWLSGCRRPK